jgi:fibronectin-binding autotransporter adhesin
MMSKQSFRAGRQIALAVAVAAAALPNLPGVARAATDTWVGNTSANWGDLNWTGGNNPPASGDSLVFGTAGSSGTTLTDNLTTGTAWNIAGITFNTGADGFTINPLGASNGFTLTGAIVDNATNAEVINDQVALTAVQTITVGAGGSLTLGGVVSGTGGITTTGTGQLTLSATGNAYSGATNVNNGTLLLSGTYSGGSAFVVNNNVSANTATLTVTGSLTSTVNGTAMIVGNRSGTAVLNVNSGSTVTLGTQSSGGNASLAIAQSSAAGDTATGTVNVNGGTLTTLGDMAVGLGGTKSGTLIINSGTVNVATTQTKWLKVGQFDTVKGEIDLNGGNLNLNAGSSIEFNSSGGAGTSVINQNAGNVTFYSDNATTVGGGGELNLANASKAGANNTYNLNGGTLTVPKVDSTQTAVTRTFNFNGGTLTAAGNNTAFFNLGTGNARANVRNGGAIINSNGFNVTVAQALLHSNVSGDNATDGGLTKNGNGILTLSGANTYNGLTTIGAGTLNLTGSLVSPVTVLSGATLTGSGNGTTGLIGGAVTLNGGGAIDFSKDGLTAPTTLTMGNGLSVGSSSGPASSLTFNINSTATDLINLTGGSLNAFAAGTPNVINLNVLGTFTPANTTYTLIDFPSGQTNLTAGNLNSLFTLGTKPTGVFTLSLALTSTSLELIESASTVPISAYWTGKLDNTWSDFTTSPVATNFSSTSDGNTDAGQIPAGITDVIFTAGSNGKGTSLSGAAINTTLGADLTINSLTINPTPSSVTIGGSNTLTLNAGASQSGTGSLGYAAGTGLVIQSGAGPVTLSTNAVALGGPQTWTNASSNNLTVNAVITGAAANGLTINNTGSGATIFNAVNTFTGGLTLANGLLQIGSASTTPTFGPTNGTVTVNGGTLDVNGTTQTIGNLAGTGGTITNNASNSFVALTIGSGNTGGGNYKGTIADGAGFLALIKNGTGAITLSGTNTYSGGTTISGGILQFATPNALSQYNIGGNLNVVNNSGVLAVNYGGPSDWTSGQVDTVRANATFNGGSAIAFDTTNAPGGATYASNIGDGAGPTGVMKLGPNTLTLTGTNTYSGYTAVRGGTLNMSGTPSMTGGIYVDNGTLNLTGGTFGTSTANNTFIVATGFQNGTGVLTIAPGVTLNEANLFVGDNGVGAGAVYQSGGSLTLTQASNVDNVRIGSSNNGVGYYNLSGGSITSNEFDVAASLANTIGVLDMSGGTVTVNGAGYIIPGRGSGTSSGVMNLTGGAMTGNRIEMNWANAAGATSVLDVGGGTGPAALATAGSTSLGLNLLNNNTAGTISVVNLLPNGTLTTGIVKATGGANPIAHLNFNGGTLVAAATNAGSSFFAAGANLDAVNVLAGGGTIDNGGTNITIANALLAPAGYGVAANSISVPTGGAGYIGAPLVKFTGGSGTGATGYAVVSNGAVTNVVVTSPGIGYAAGDTLTATFFGGGGTTAASPVTGIPVAQNVSGGMTFQGAGITVLTATNTWTGNTTVTAGTLQVDGSLANTPVTVASGATLAGKGTINNAGANAVTVNGTVAPGTASSNAKLTTGPEAWNAGGSYTWKLNTNNATSNATVSGGTTDPGGAGANWDTLSMSSLTLPSTGSFTINLTPFSGTGTNAFNGGSSYAWTIADVSGGQGNYANLMAHLTLNAAPLATATNTPASDYSLGLMSDGGGGQDLVVSYSPAPEPTSLALAGLAAGGLLLRRRRRAAR